MRGIWIVAGMVVTLAVAACGSTVTTTAIASPPPAGSPAASSQEAAIPSADASGAPASPAATGALVTTAPSATSKPTPTPKPTPPPISACKASQLKAKVTEWQGAMGSQYASVTLTNTSSVTCKVRGTPESQLVDAASTILIDSKTQGASGLPHVAPSDKAFLLAHNGSVRTMVQVSNYCGAAPVLPTTVAFVLPSNGGRLVAAPVPGGDVPGCLGASGSAGSISMNGWTK
jgi:hypothetical protein